MSNDSRLILFTLAAVILSALIDRRKTVRGVLSGLRMLIKLMPQFLMLLVFVSVFLTLVPLETLTSILGKEAGSLGVLLAAGIGSIAMVPAAVAYPLAGMLAANGVPMTVIAVFITTLMMVGILTFPLEKAYIGARLAILRNVLSLAGALVTGLIVGYLL